MFHNSVKITLKWTWHLKIKGLMFHSLWSLELCQAVDRVSELSHSECDFSISFNVHVPLILLQEQLHLLGQRAWEQAVLQVLSRYRPGT